MDFNIDQVNADLIRAKKHIQENEFPDGLKYLGKGQNGVVCSLNSVAIKKHKYSIDPIRQRGMLEFSELGIKQDIKFAPYLDFINIKTSESDISDFSFMPKLEGPTFGDGKFSDKLDNMLEIGADGFERFISDFLALRKIGFHIDYINENFIITTNPDSNKKHISFIDLQAFAYPKPKPKFAINTLTKFALRRFTHPEYMKRNSGKMRELLHITDTALKKIDQSKLAREEIARMQKELA